MALKEGWCSAEPVKGNKSHDARSRQNCTAITEKFCFRERWASWCDCWIIISEQTFRAIFDMDKTSMKMLSRDKLEKKTASIAPTAMWRESDPLSLATFSIVFYTLPAPIVYRNAHVLQCHQFGRYFAQHDKKRNLTKLLLSKPVLQTYLPSKKVTTRLIKRLSSTLSLSTFL